MKLLSKKMFILVFAIIGAFSLNGIICPPVYAKENVKEISFTTESKMDSITLKWKRQKNVGLYKVYRMDITKKIEKSKFSPKRKNYKMIVQLSGNSCSFIDKKVSFGHCYAYFIDGFKKINGKTKKVCTSYYIDGSYQPEYAGLSKPEVTKTLDTNNKGDISKVKLYFEVSTSYGVKPDGVQFYRKEKGEKKYKKIATKSLNRFDGNGTFSDSSVKAGKTYSYKVRSYVKKGGKKYWSAYSKPLTIQAVNYDGFYKVKSITPAGNTDQFVIKLTSHKNNGTTKIYSKYQESYITTDLKGKNLTEIITLVQWSEDGTLWKKIPEKGIKLEAGKTIYLKYSLSTDDGSTPYYGGSTSSKSQIEQICDDECNFEYIGPSLGYPSLKVDIASGKGHVFTDSEL